MRKKLFFGAIFIALAVAVTGGIVSAAGALDLPSTVRTGQSINWTVPHDTVGCPRHLWLRDLREYYPDATVTPYRTSAHAYDDPGLVSWGVNHFAEDPNDDDLVMRTITGRITLEHSGRDWDPDPEIYVDRITSLKADFGGMEDVQICAARTYQIVTVRR